MSTKRKIKILSGIAVVATALVVTFFSCKKSNEIAQNPTQTNSTNPSITVFDKSYTPLTYLIPYKKKEPNLSAKQSGIVYSYSKVLLQLTEIENIYKDLISNYGSNIPSSASPKAIVLYSNNSFENITTNNATGFSVLTFSSGKLEHRLYEIKNGTASEVTKFYFLFNSYDANDFSLLLDQTLKPNDNFASYLWLTSGEFNGFRAPAQESVYLTANLIENGIMNRPYIPGDVENQCEACDGNSETESCDTDENGESFCTGGCQNTSTDRIAKKLKKPFDLDFSKAYDFRDNFLNKHEKAKIYAVYYYKLSYVIVGLSLINKNTFDQTVEMTKRCYALAERIQYGNDNEIIITPELKDYFDAILDDYKSKSSNIEFKQILNKLKSDLNQFKNKTRAQLVNALK